MAREDSADLCDRLFDAFLAPLVLGGALRPVKAIGGKRALCMAGQAPRDSEAVSRTQLARVRVARKLAPVDRFEEAPTGPEWALAAALHDLVQATHPGFNAAFRQRGPAQILDVIEQTIERIPLAPTPGDALSRHTWLSRMFDLARTDVEVKWWTGSETFMGENPPARLTAWPEVRRVEQTLSHHRLMDLSSASAAVDDERFACIVQQLLTRTPLTDFATIDRATPRFVWQRATLTLCATHTGRTLVLRALARCPSRITDAALGRATRALFSARDLTSASLAVDILRDRALAAAERRTVSSPVPPTYEAVAAEANDPDRAFATSIGALAATQWIAENGGGFGAVERERMLRTLAPAANAPAARELKALLSG